MRPIKFRAWVIAEKVMGNVNLVRPDMGAFVEGAMPDDDTEYPDYVVLAPGNGMFCNWSQIKLDRKSVV